MKFNETTNKKRETWNKTENNKKKVESLERDSTVKNIETVNFQKQNFVESEWSYFDVSTIQPYTYSFKYKHEAIGIITYYFYVDIDNIIEDYLPFIDIAIVARALDNRERILTGGYDLANLYVYDYVAHDWITLYDDKIDEGYPNTGYWYDGTFDIGFFNKFYIKMSENKYRLYIKGQFLVQGNGISHEDEEEGITYYNMETKQVKVRYVLHKTIPNQYTEKRKFI